MVSQSDYSGARASDSKYSIDSRGLKLGRHNVVDMLSSDESDDQNHAEVDPDLQNSQLTDGSLPNLNPLSPPKHDIANISATDAIPEHRNEDSAERERDDDTEQEDVVGGVESSPEALNESQSSGGPSTGKSKSRRNRQFRKQYDQV